MDSHHSNEEEAQSDERKTGEHDGRDLHSGMTGGVCTRLCLCMCMFLCVSITSISTLGCVYICLSNLHAIRWAKTFVFLNRTYVCEKEVCKGSVNSLGESGASQVRDLL